MGSRVGVTVGLTTLRLGGDDADWTSSLLGMIFIPELFVSFGEVWLSPHPTDDTNSATMAIKGTITGNVRGGDR